jgi:hypothetical protein
MTSIYFKVNIDPFDREKVIKAQERRTAKKLNQIGGYIRKTAARSMKKNKGISRPGQAPFSHTRRVSGNIRYAVDKATQSVVVGILPFPSRFGQPGAEKLEHGGNVVAKSDNGKTTILHFRARPGMGLALEKSLPATGRILAE